MYAQEMLHRQVIFLLLINIVGSVGAKPYRRLGVLPTMPRRCVHQSIPLIPNRNVRPFNPRHTGAEMALRPRSRRYNQ